MVVYSVDYHSKSVRARALERLVGLEKRARFVKGKAIIFLSYKA